MRKGTLFTLSAISIVLLAITGCNKSRDVSNGDVSVNCPTTPTTIKGTGATFPEPLYQVWIVQYQGACANQKISYEGTGSGKGAKAAIEMTTTFGASDTGFSEQDLQKNPDLVMLPLTGGGIAVAYNLPQAPSLKLTRSVLVDIFSGTITKWNDPKIQAINPHYTLPELPISVVVRGDSSGSTATFSQYLAVDQSWNQRYGTGKEINFPPQAIRADGGSDLAQKLTENHGAIGYLETGKAKTTGLSIAAVQNRQNQFVLPDENTIQTGLGSI